MESPGTLFLSVGAMESIRLASVCMSGFVLSGLDAVNFAFNPYKIL